MKSVMIPKERCITVESQDSVNKALDLLTKREVDAIPVLEDGMYEGIITRYGIYRRFFEGGTEKQEFLESMKVKDIAAYQEKYLQGNEAFEKTLLDLKNLPLLPVVDSRRRFLGVVTRYDVLEQFQSAFGVKKPGIRIAFTSLEAEGRLSRLAEIIQQYEESVISIVTFDESDKLVRRIVLKIEKKGNVEKFIQKLESSGFRILDIAEDHLPLPS
ncbi:MAG TPA: CBS domain-containing protein [Bacillaceae bacterium]